MLQNCYKIVDKFNICVTMCYNTVTNRQKNERNNSQEGFYYETKNKNSTIINCTVM